MRDWMQFMLAVFVPLFRLVAFGLFVAWMSCSALEMTPASRLLLYAYAVQWCVVLMLWEPAKRTIFAAQDGPL